MVLIVSLFLIIRRPLRSTSSYTHFPQTPLFRSGRALHHYPPGGRIMSEQAVHANCVALDGRAVLLMGASGSGKSDLALRLIDRGWSLVSDDYVTLECRGRSEEHTSELQSLMRISYAVFCLKKKNTQHHHIYN